MEDVVLAAEHGFTDYELVRIGRIERNNARLLQLGLISKHEADVSNARAKGIEVVEESDRDDSASGSEYGDDDDDDDGEFLEGKKRRAAQGKKKKRKKSIEKDSVPRAPTRNSRRLQGQAPDGTVYDITLPRTAEEIALERESRVEVCREARLKAANQLAELGLSATEMAKKNPSATYEHCAMRVRTMTEKALANRVKVIERAAGKHCVVKMAIFKSCLQDKKMWELAELARDSLERLMEATAVPDDE